MPDERPLRLAYLSYRSKPTVGGQGIYTRHLTKALADLGHTIEVFSGQPYPVLDPRVTLHQLPSLDLFNDAYPGRFPAVLGVQDESRLPRDRHLLDRNVSRAAGFQLPGLSGVEAPSRRLRPGP